MNIPGCPKCGKGQSVDGTLCGSCSTTDYKPLSDEELNSGWLNDMLGFNRTGRTLAEQARRANALATAVKHLREGTSPVKRDLDAVVSALAAYLGEEP